MIRQLRMRRYNEKQIEKIIGRNREWIDSVSERFRIPAAAIAAVLRKELKEIDYLDAAADLIVRMGIFKKKDSSTGPMQIFGKTGVRAVNYAQDRGIASYSELGIPSSHRLDARDRRDVRLVWKKLHCDEHANIEIAALNLLSAAEEMTGRIDFAGYTPEELKHIFTRYNQDTRRITPYGEETYQYYLQFLQPDNGELQTI